jgi:hypothetical protein
MDFVQAFLEGLVGSLPILIPAIIDGVTEIITALVEMLPEIIELAINLVMQLIDALIPMAPTLIKAALSLLMGVVNALIKNVPIIVDAVVNAIPLIVNGLIEALPQIIEAAIQIIFAIQKGLFEALPQLLKGVWTLLKTMISKVKEIIPQMLQTGKDLISGLWNGMLDILKGLPAKLLQQGKDLVKSFFKGFKGDADVDVNVKGGGTPATATGGVVTSPQRRLVGEDGAEAIMPMPLERNTGWITSLARNLSTLMQYQTPKPATLAMAGGIPMSIVQNISYTNTFNGSDRKLQESASKTMDKSADNVNAKLARAIRNQR